MFKHVLALVTFCTRKLRRFFGLPVADLTEARTELGRSVHAMESKTLPVEPPK